MLKFVEDAVNDKIIHKSSSNTIIYGIVHTLSLLTVCNKELHMKALADKDMTYEQYQEMRKLQKLKINEEKGKSTVDEGENNGILEDNDEDDEDDDTDELCKRRITKIVSCDGIKALVKILEYSLLATSSISNKTKELVCRTLRQICVVEGVVRGTMIQQGGLKACNSIVSAATSASATEKAFDNQIRREAAHAVAKTLITINPILVKDHQRIASIHSLLYLCKDNDSTNLMQFEGLLAVTNLISVGQSEKECFTRESAIHTVHYLMFSDHPMVRRAATECLCNMAGEESLLKLLRDPSKVRMWIGFAEEFTTSSTSSTSSSESSSNCEDNEVFLTARAACGTLASSCQDVLVTQACITEDIQTMLNKILVTNSENNKKDFRNVELIHRVLVMIKMMCIAEYSENITSSTNLNDQNAEKLEKLENLQKDIITYLVKHKRFK